MNDPDEGGAEAPDASGELPHIDFATFVLSLSHSALVHLGDAPDPSGESHPANLELARQTIDVLGILEAKTRGNLTGEEERLLSTVLYDLRFRYVQASQKK